MFLKKKLIADLLFWIQIVCAFILCGSQFFRFLETTKGQLLSMFLIMEAYLYLHLMLAVGAHRAQPSRVTRQTLWTYAMWLVLILSNIVAIFSTVAIGGARMTRERLRSLSSVQRSCLL